MDQEVGDLLEFAGIRDIKDVISAVVQVIARSANRTEGGVAGGHS
jgi:hypothetical protein